MKSCIQIKEVVWQEAFFKETGLPAVGEFTKKELKDIRIVERRMIVYKINWHIKIYGVIDDLPFEMIK